MSGVSAIFLDRDGVLLPTVVGVDGVPRPTHTLTVLPGVIEGCALLRSMGYRLVIVTNQPDVARGTQPRDAVEATNEWLRAMLAIDDVRTCFHDDADDCSCRKPKPGMIIDAARDLGIDLGTSFVVGDRAKDIEAARRAGCRAIYIDHAYPGAETVQAEARFKSLLEASLWIQRNVQRSVEDARRMAAEALSRLTIKIFADGADPEGIRTMAANPLISGFTTNPTLMRKANVPNYREFATEVLRLVGGRPVSFEVFADDFDEMETQAIEIASWGSNVHVKIPITNTSGEPSHQLLTRLARQGVQVNVTAILTVAQVRGAASALSDVRHGYVSVFAGRIADTGRDPLPVMQEALRVLEPYPKLELLWASPRELLNIFQADSIGCHVITASNDIIEKLALVGRDLDDYSLATVRMFYDDARRAGYSLERPTAVDASGRR